VALASSLPWELDFLHCVDGLGVLGWPKLVLYHGGFICCTL
jgi:hypothetical protein